MQTSYSSHPHVLLIFCRPHIDGRGDREGLPMYSICSKTLAIALAALWVVFTPTQPVPPTTPVNDHTLLHSPAAHVVLWSQSEEPACIELRVPEALVNALPTEERSSETIDLRVPEALLEHLYGAGRISGLEKSPAPWDEPFCGKISVALDWPRPGYAPARTCSGQRGPTAGPLPVPAEDQYVLRR